jgi:DNA-binding MarR family transcriptional regulator
MDWPPPTTEVIAAAISSGRLLEAAIERALEWQDLTWSRYHALLVMAEAGGMLHGASIARTIGVSRQSAHETLQRFDARGMLRWRNESWIRSVWLSPDGAQVFDEATGQLGEIFAAIERTSIEERWGIVRAGRAIRRELRRPPRNTWWYEHLLEPQSRLWIGDP